MGGGVSSAVARALGGGTPAAARRLVAHAVVIALAAGLAFTLLLIGLSADRFTLSSAVRTARSRSARVSDVLVRRRSPGVARRILSPARCAAASTRRFPRSLSSPRRWCRFPSRRAHARLVAASRSRHPRHRLSYALAFGVAALGMGLYLWSSALRPRGSDWRSERRLFGEILRVARCLPVSALQTVLTAIILTGCVGSFRHRGARRLRRRRAASSFCRCRSSSRSARRSSSWSALTSAPAALCARRESPGPARVVAMGVSLAIGVSAALFPAAWVRIFSNDPGVLETRRPLSADRRAVLRAVRRGHGALFRLARRGPRRRPMLAGTARLASWPWED